PSCTNTSATRPGCEGWSVRTPFSKSTYPRQTTKRPETASLALSDDWPRNEKLMIRANPAMLTVNSASARIHQRRDFGGDVVGAAIGLPQTLGRSDQSQRAQCQQPGADGHPHGHRCGSRQQPRRQQRPSAECINQPGQAECNRNRQSNAGSANPERLLDD